jgi:hypothetical protein
MYDADRDTALDEPILGTSFSLRQARVQRRKIADWDADIRLFQNGQSNS